VAQHDRFQGAGQLVHRIELSGLLVQTGIDLIEASSLQASLRRLGGRRTW
jgi:hypothetical protein